MILRTAIVQIITWAERRCVKMKIKIKQNKMEIIKGHKFYDIWGRNDLLFVEGVEGSGIFEQLSFNFWVQNYLFL